MGLPDYVTCLLRNVYAGQKATVRNRHGKIHWFKIGKGVRQGCILSPWLFNLHAEPVQSLSHVQLFATPWTAAHQASLCITNSQSLLKLMSMASVMPLSTTNWHFARALPMTEQQGHLPSASMEIEPHAAIAVDLQQPLKEFRVEWGPLCSKESGGTSL